MDGKRVCVVIPIYRKLHKWEEVALRHNLSVLDKYKSFLVYPEGFYAGTLHEEYPQLGLIKVSDGWLGSKNGIQGYNAMMLSERFYALFEAYDYMLICHVDAWIFRDDLALWCQKGYDLVAAPWPTRPFYRTLVGKLWLRIKLFFKPKDEIYHCQLFGKVGNGGLSLRRISAFREACRTYADKLNYYRNKYRDNEDVLWAVVPSFKVPSEKAALGFAFDNKPSICFRLNGDTLPMGCHGFNHKNRYKFWKRYIAVSLQ